MNPLVIGVDFGTDSVRAVIVDAHNGDEVAIDVARYPRWSAGKYNDPSVNRFRQHPLDYIESMTACVRGALASVPASSRTAVKAISIDTTGSTPVAVDRAGTPLAMLPEFAENPNAMFVLWKDHTAVREAEEINALARSWGGVDFTRFEGGTYSSEWFWAKLLHIMREDPEVCKASFSWVEHCDWITAHLTGTTDPLTIKRSRCAAGHKAMWHASFDGLPSQKFLTLLDPLLRGVRQNLFRETWTSDTVAGKLSPSWAGQFGLSTDVRVGVGAFDAHMGAVGGEIRPYVLTKIMGTSTCDMIVAPANEMGEKLVRGICGQVDGSILPGMIGMEAGQSAFGDVYAWFRDLLLWPVEHVLGKSTLLDEPLRRKLVEEAGDQVIEVLSRAAESVSLDVAGPLAVDWMNGRRTPDANQLLKGAVAGINLGTDAPKIFRALVEATAFGARRIAERFRSEGVRIDGVIALGGVPKKSPFVMQVVADVMNMEITVPRSEQTCALGAAMFAATVAEIHPTVEAAREAMGSGVERVFTPDPPRAKSYDVLYQRYCRLADFLENETMTLRRDA